MQEDPTAGKEEAATSCFKQRNGKGGFIIHDLSDGNRTTKTMIPKGIPAPVNRQERESGNRENQENRTTTTRSEKGFGSRGLSVTTTAVWSNNNICMWVLLSFSLFLSLDPNHSGIRGAVIWLCLQQRSLCSCAYIHHCLLRVPVIFLFHLLISESLMRETGRKLLYKLTES